MGGLKEYHSLSWWRTILILKWCHSENLNKFENYIDNTKMNNFVISYTHGKSLSVDLYRLLSAYQNLSN